MFVLFCVYRDLIRISKFMFSVIIEKQIFELACSAIQIVTRIVSFLLD